MGKKDRLTLESTVSFLCHKGLSCFTHCCRDVNIFLTPYDILRIKKRLGIPSGEFLSRHTLSLIPEKSGFPLVILKMDEERDRRCPFVESAGCSIYKDRPWSCRMYPLDRGDQEGEFCYVTDGSFCFGMKEKGTWSVRQYLQNQSLEQYNEMEKPFVKITSNPLFTKEKIQNPKIQDMCRLALYDIDRFRRFVLESRFLEIFYVEKELVKSCREDDLELMKLAYRWLEFGLFAGDGMKIREDLIKNKGDDPER